MHKTPVTPTTLQKLLENLLSSPRIFKRMLVFGVDSMLCIGAIWVAFSLRLGEWQLWSDAIAKIALASFALWPPVFYMRGIYRSIFRFAGSGTMADLAKATGLVGIGLVAIFVIAGVPGVPRTIGIIMPLCFFLFLAFSRLVARYIFFDLMGRRGFGGTVKNVLIFGAGNAGQQLAVSMRHDHAMNFAGFVDDDKRLRGQRLDGHIVWHTSEIKKIIAQHGITDILLALPNISRSRRKKIVDDLQKLHIHVQTLPQMQEILDGKVTIGDLREVDIDDLLGRDAVSPNELLMGRTIAGKTVVVTGAGGSIGSELCRQILAIGPKRLILAEMTEHALYAIDQELRGLIAAGKVRSDIQLFPELVNTANIRPVRSLFATYQPDTVFHAAAYKHVPLVEQNPIAGMNNNIFSTLNMALEARAARVAHFILVSTDKAVRPTNVMGATKRVCEQILQALSKTSAATGAKTRFSMVRFGNVLGSSGSVVPLFKEQIANGGPLTLTHRKITRFFMTIPEAAQLVIQAGAMAKGGEVFVLDMGKPVKIFDLATMMIKLSGLSVRDGKNPDGDIEIKEIGLRPAEKLYEELLIGENPKPTNHQRIMQAREKFIEWSVLEERLEALRHRIIAADSAGALALLRQLVPEYQPAAANDDDNRETA